MASTPLGMFSVPTPQDIITRNNAMRQQQWSSGNPYQMQQATVSNALDSIFGNPEAKLQQRLQDKLQSAQATVQPVAGETQVEQELRRLQSMRDAVGSLDPNVANQINSRMLELGQVKLEQDKLVQDTQYKAAEEARNVAKFPAEMTKLGAEAVTAANEGQNYWKKGANGIDRKNVSTLDSIERRRLRADGWAEGNGPTTEAEAGDALGLSKPSINELQKSIIEGDNYLANIGSVVEKFDPAFLTAPVQAAQWANGKVEWLTGKPLSPELASQGEKYYEWRANAADGINAYIHKITGAAVGIQEEKRIRQASPDPYKDSASQFLSKLRAQTKMALGVRKRAQDLLSRGTVVSRADLDSISIPQVSDAEVDQFLQSNFGLPARGGSSAPEGRNRQQEIDAIINGKK